MALQKFRVICPYCEASLLVTEDLLGQPGQCPGCQQDFLLPDLESFITVENSLEPEPERIAPVPAPVASAPIGTPPPLSLSSPVSASDRNSNRRSNTLKPVRMENRPALRLLSFMMKIMAGFQVVAGCGVLVTLVVLSSRSPLPAIQVLIAVGIALGIGLSAIPTLAFSELILVFIAQEEMLRHLVNHERTRQDGT